MASLALTDAEEDAESRFLETVGVFSPEVVQVGPLTDPGLIVAQSWDGPLIAASWGFDLLLEIDQSEEMRAHAAKTLNRADLVFVDSDAAQAASLELGALPESVVQFPWGLETEWLTHAPVIRCPSSTPTFLCTRRHDAMYRVGDVIEAFALSNASCSGAELWLAGHGPLTRHLEGVAEDLGVSARVRFLGAQTQRELRNLFARADVYISATETDGTSVSLLEAMISGVPVVVSAIPGNAQWVTDASGWTFPTGDTHELAQLIDLFCNPSRELWTDIAHRAVAARAKVLTQANWPEAALQFGNHAQLAIDRARLRLGIA